MHGTVFNQLRVVDQEVAAGSSGRELGKIIVKGFDILGIEWNRDELSQEEFLVDMGKIQGNGVVEDHTIVGLR